VLYIILYDLYKSVTAFFPSPIYFAESSLI